MPKRSLIQTNRYLRDPEKRRMMFVLTVCTSAGVEEVRLTPADLLSDITAARRPAGLHVSGSPSLLQKQPRIRT